MNLNEWIAATNHWCKFYISDALRCETGGVIKKLIQEMWRTEAQPRSQIRPVRDLYLEPVLCFSNVISGRNVCPTFHRASLPCCPALSRIESPQARLCFPSPVSVSITIWEPGSSLGLFLCTLKCWKVVKPSHSWAMSYLTHDGRKRALAKWEKGHDCCAERDPSTVGNQKILQQKTKEKGRCATVCITWTWKCLVLHCFQSVTVGLLAEKDKSWFLFRAINSDREMS